MATVFRPLERFWAPRPSWHPGVTGLGSACGRCTLRAKRYLLTDSIMKLKEFQQKKVATAHNLPSTKAIYFRSLEEKLTQNKLILKEELKTLLHLCQSREDVELAKSVIYRYHSENRNFTVGEYKFGPVFMRLCYELHLEDSAVELIKDKHLRGFFLDSTSFNILMDMLFTKGKYESALEVLIEMKNQDVKFTKDTYILAFAVCYRLNSPESFKICTTLREEALIKGDILPRRASCFAVALALNQNQVEKAMSIFSQIMNPESVTCANLNILIHVRSNMLENLIKILQDNIDRNVSLFVKRHMFSEEVVNRAMWCDFLPVSMTSGRPMKVSAVMSPRWPMQLGELPPVCLLCFSGKPVPHDYGMLCPTLTLSTKQAIPTEDEADCLKFSQEPTFGKKMYRCQTD